VVEELSDSDTEDTEQQQQQQQMPPEGMEVQPPPASPPPPAAGAPVSDGLRPPFIDTEPASQHWRQQHAAMPSPGGVWCDSSPAGGALLPAAAAAALSPQASPGVPSPASLFGANSGFPAPAWALQQQQQPPGATTPVGGVGPLQQALVPPVLQESASGGMEIDGDNDVHRNMAAAATAEACSTEPPCVQPAGMEVEPVPPAGACPGAGAVAVNSALPLPAAGYTMLSQAAGGVVAPVEAAPMEM
jgi:hypothetical protein